MTDTIDRAPHAASDPGPTLADGAHVDVLVVGAGISGIGAAHHLRTRRPETSFAVVETQDDFGGTWRTHTYPGIRSDSDLYTFGYRFKPWTSAPIATAEEILRYLGEVIDEADLDRDIHYGHRVQAARWSSDEDRWSIDLVRTDGERLRVTAGLLWMCQGYYRHDEGYTPEWEGTDDFAGRIVHPQTWPADLDLTGKRVVVIGSGATAATLIPAIAGTAAHVTMLQRSPTYFATGRNANDLADTLRELEIDETWIHEIVRRKNLFDSAVRTRMAFEDPELLKAALFEGIREFIDDEELIAEHFTPSYLPWRQRIAFVPDGDLFRAIADGDASVVTDHIDRFVPEGIRTRSGDVLEADVVITATGFHLNVLGDIGVEIDDRPLDFASTVTWRGAMFTDIPNFVWVFGYFRSSWTLRADLVADFVLRLLDHMASEGAATVTPRLRAVDEEMTLRPWVTEENFNPGYIQRGLHLLPRQGDRAPWLHTQDYEIDKLELPAADLDDGSLEFR